MAVAINPDQQAAVLRVTAYHRRDFDVIVVRSDPQKQSIVQPFISEPFLSPASAPLGALRYLPSEVLVYICSYLDILSSFRLRQVNRKARQVISGSPAYRDLSRYGLDSIRAALRTRIASWLLVSDLYHTLCTTECSQCGFFGPLLFLPTAERCCYSCLDSSPNYRIVSLSTLSKVSRVSPSQLRRLVPVLNTIPGKYDIPGNHYKKSLNLVAERTVLQRKISLDTQHILTSIPEHRGRSGNMALRCMMATAFPSLDKVSSNVEDGVSCKGCQVALETGSRENPSTLAPYELRDRSYSREGFLVHFQSCEEAQKLWQASYGGAIPAIEPACTKNGGFISKLEAEQYYK